MHRLLATAVHPQPARLAGWLIASGLILSPLPCFAVPEANPIGTYATGVTPYGMAIAPSGETYVVNSLASRVEKYSRAGTHLLGWGSSGGGPGQFDFAADVALDLSGDILVLDANSSRIQRFSPAGTYLGEFGTSGSGQGEFSSPRAIAVDEAGHIYVADTYNHRIQKLSSLGVYSAEWGAQGSGPGQFSYPYGVAVDAAGDIYVADTYNHRIQKFDASGAFLKTWGSEGTGNGQFVYPSAVAVDGGGNVYVTDTNNHRVQRFTSTGVFVSKWGTMGNGTAQFLVPQGLDVASNGDVHVADTGNSRVQIYRSRNSQGHEAILMWGSAGGGNGEFSAMAGVAVAPDGSVYVVDRLGNRVQKFTGFGAWADAWGTQGSGDGELSQPVGVAVDTDGNVYVADHLNARVQKFTAAGAYLSQWGTAGAGPGQFTGVWDIAIDGDDNVYVVDAHRVQRFTTAGGFVNEWACAEARGIGTDAEGSVYVACYDDPVVRKYKGDGTFVLEWGSFGSNPGQFDHPSDVAADSAGYVHVCEIGNRIQKFTPLGGYVSECGETGSGFRQLDAPQMLAVDAAGSVYVTEFSNYRVQKFASTPELLEIADVPGDEGGWAQVTFTRSSAEAPGSGAAPTAYTIHRWEQSPPAIVLVATIPIDGVTTTAIVSTGANATGVFTGLKEYEVRLQTNVPDAFALQEFNEGFSVDNLAPPSPSPLLGAYESGATALHWDESPVPDFDKFRLYRGELPDFALDPGSLIHASADTGYSDVGPAGRYYALVAADTSGNASPPAWLGPNETVAVPGDESSLAFRLEEVLPNPSRGSGLRVRFTLPDARPARVELVNVAGRRLWSRDASGAGPHEFRVHDDARLASGVYFIRLSQGARSLVRRVAVVE